MTKTAYIVIHTPTGHPITRFYDKKDAETYINNRTIPGDYWIETY